jgi:hypothetical protein
MSRQIIFKINLDGMIHRLKKLLDFEYDNQLAKLLDITPQGFIGMKKKGTLLPRFIDYAIDHKINLQWLVYGEGSARDGDEGAYFKGGVAEPGGDYGNPLEARVAILEQQCEEIKNLIKKGPPGGPKSSDGGAGDIIESDITIRGPDRPFRKSE